MAERLELLVLAGLELLVFQAGDRLLAGLDLELDALDGHLVGHHRGLGGVHRALVVAEVGGGALLVDGDFREVFFHREKPLVAVLEDEKCLDLREHVAPP